MEVTAQRFRDVRDLLETIEGSPLHSVDRNGNKIKKSIVREVSVVQMRAIDKSQPGTNNDTRDRRSS